VRSGGIKLDKRNSRIWFIFGLFGGLLVCLLTVLILYFSVIRPQSITTAKIVATQEQQTAIAKATEATQEAIPPVSTQEIPDVEPTSQEEQVNSTPTELSEKLIISANLNTNCREGPDTDYAIVGHLNRGQTSEVEGTNTYQTWWYIKNPENLEQYCWVWGDTTYVEGDISDLRVVTPPPPPPPGPNYDATFVGYSTCDEYIYAVFEIENTGATDLQSMSLLIINTTKEHQLHFTSMMNRPFSSDRKACMRNWGYMEPGDIAYIAGDIVTSGYLGDEAQAQIKLCENDSLKGRCVDNIVNFEIPYQ